MRAYQVHRPGGPEILKLREIPKPQAKPGWVLIKVKAFGINRAEIYKRQSLPGFELEYPIVLGLECVGLVEDGSDSGLKPGQKVAALVGGLGRFFDGGYAEYTLAPASNVIPLKTDLPWDVLGAIPESYLTAWHCLVDCLEAKKGESLLVRAGTSALGMAAIALAKEMGLSVVATTRNQAKVKHLLAQGADQTIIDSGLIEPEVKRLYPKGVNRVLELVGTASLRDSLKFTAPFGTVCLAGILNTDWSLPDFKPLKEIPSTVKLTAYSSRDVLTAANSAQALQEIVDKIAAGQLKGNLYKVFPFDQAEAAHRMMEANQAAGKLVVVVD